MSKIVELKIEDIVAAVGGVGMLVDTMVAARRPHGGGGGSTQEPPQVPSNGQYPFPRGTANQPPR